MIASGRKVKVHFKTGGYLEGRNKKSYKGDGAIEIIHFGKKVIIPSDSISYVEQISF